MASKYDPETRAKAVRLLLDHRDDYPSEWAAITAVSKRLGMTAETLRSWIRQQQIVDKSRAYLGTRLVVLIDRRDDIAHGVGLSYTERLRPNTRTEAPVVEHDRWHR